MSLNNPFLKETPLYKEYAILELLSKDSNLTQRVIAEKLNSSLSMINQYLDNYEERKLILKVYLNGKKIEYSLTKKGFIRLKELNFQYLESVRNVYLKAKEHIVDFLDQIKSKGITKIIMYGAGEVAELTLQVINESDDNELEILSIIDDDISKQSNVFMNIKIVSFQEAMAMQFDAILITSFTHGKTIRKKLNEYGYDNYNIYDYFYN
ncbi:winged helix-turn-helix transcriptional regulator [Candidatus Izemoplasma sp. B36]|uniref:winged helix-turn-helix transcriptional regulator n=1 Tax=Candidatus Izemoplasma sp. B36 TaxID=3242468 RepID=UPI00355649FF